MGAAPEDVLERPHLCKLRTAVRGVLREHPAVRHSDSDQRRLLGVGPGNGRSDRRHRAEPVDDRRPSREYPKDVRDKSTRLRSGGNTAKGALASDQVGPSRLASGQRSAWPGSWAASVMWW